VQLFQIAVLAKFAASVARRIGEGRAKLLMFTGEPIDAETALAWGLVNRVVPSDRLDAEVRALAGSILAKSPAVVAAGKKVFYQQVDADLEKAYRVATAAMVDNARTDDGREGIAAFAGKRKPKWKNKN